MTENDDRMDRAKRIRRMREGRRDPDDDGEPAPDDGAGANSVEGETDGGDVDEELPDETPVEETGSDASEGHVDSKSSASDDLTDAERAPSDDSTDGQSTDNTLDDQSEWFDGDHDADPEAASESDTVDDGGSTDESEAIASSVAAAASEFEVEDGTDPSEGAGQSDAPTEIEGPATTETDEPEQEAEEEIRVLEFRLGDEQYCLDIRHVEEIVKEETITRVPNTPEHVRGVVDLRGQITTILDPKISLDIEEVDSEQLIIVFDEETFEDQGHAGWIVDEVRQVMPITESEVKESPLDQQAVNGVVERDEEFIIWAEPEVALLDE